MQKNIEICGENIEYTLKANSRSRRVSLVIQSDGKLVATGPRGLNIEIVENFILQKSKWILDKLNYFKKNISLISVRGGKGDYKKRKDDSLAMVSERLKFFNMHYNLKWNKISIRNQKSRWGSCSRKGNLNFNYKIIHLPAQMADYIIVHEMCHLKQFNHSKNFWNLVGEAIPDYMEIRRELQKSRISFM